MGATHTKRDEPQFYNVLELDWGAVGDAAIAHGVDAKVLSADSDTGSATWMLRVPAGWQHDYAADDAAVELFVFEGDLALNGAQVGAGGFVTVPQGSGTSDLRSTGGAQAVLYYNPGLPLDGEAKPNATRLWQEPWINIEGIPALHGLMFKSLRKPDVTEGEWHGGPGGLIRVASLPAGFADADEHVHDCWEELIFIGGDLLMPPRGKIARGTYLGNPEGFYHAPMTTQAGSLMLVQTLAPANQIPRPYPDGKEIVDGYRDSESFLGEIEQTDWDELPDFTERVLVGA